MGMPASLIAPNSARELFFQKGLRVFLIATEKSAYPELRYKPKKSSQRCQIVNSGKESKPKCKNR